MTPDAAPTARLRERIQAEIDRLESEYFEPADTWVDSMTDPAFAAAVGEDCRKMLALLREARAALSLGSAGPQWQPIETAPKDKHVIFWTVQEYEPPSFVKPNLGSLHFGKFGSWSSLERATHWMPLPDPPGGSAGPPTQEGDTK